ncbi:MAG: hypothetical protein ABI479_11525 [Gallionella sp.]
MTMQPALAQRLKFLARVVRKERQYLVVTDERLFRTNFTSARVAEMENDPELADRVEAFVGRFGRLQDTLGDKLLPALLSAMGEKTSSVIDNLDRAERLGLIKSADEWLTIRDLRNQMIHEYIEDAELLSSALQTGHAFVTGLSTAADNIIGEIERRGWV